MTPTEIEKLRERAEERITFLGKDAAASHVSLAQFIFLTEALSAKDAEIERLRDRLTVSEARTYLSSDAEMERRALAAEAALKEAREEIRLRTLPIYAVRNGDRP
jgi:hypothetical protein